MSDKESLTVEEEMSIAEAGQALIFRLIKMGIKIDKLESRISTLEKEKGVKQSGVI